MTYDQLIAQARAKGYELEIRIKANTHDGKTVGVAADLNGDHGPRCLHTAIEAMDRRLAKDAL